MTLSMPAAWRKMDRQPFEAEMDEGTGALSNIAMTDEPPEPAPNERGWKDTAVMLPGERTRVIAKFDRKGLYVWHCHILSHEDHEMMRPFEVINRGQGRDADLTEERELTVFPNPFQDGVTIVTDLPSAGTVRFEVFDVMGRRVHGRTVDAEAGQFLLDWNGHGSDGAPLGAGTYMFRLQLDDVLLHTGRLERMK